MPSLKQIQAKLKKLQAQTEHLIAQRAQAVLDDIRAMMERHGLTTHDIEKHSKKTKPRVVYPAPAGRHEAMTKLAKKGKLPAKYRNPKTGETWSGWARPPAWIANVKDRSKFLIDAEGGDNASKPKAAAKKVAAKKSTAVAAKKAEVPQTRGSTATNRAAAPAAKKTVASKTAGKTAGKTTAKRSAPRKRAAKTANVAPAPEQNIASTPEAATTSPTDNPTA
jgi:DNA-binding protein H-NS